MNTHLVTLMICLFGLSMGFSQEEVNGLKKDFKRQAVPAEILADAVRATQAVGDQTLKGEFDAVVEKLYPRSRKRAAKKLGGNQAVVDRMREMVNEFSAGGMALTKFVAEPAIHGFDIPEYREWLVFVPTTRTVRRISPETGLTQFLEITDYQVAIRKKEAGSEWSFINGSTLKISELRSFFPTLPIDIQYAIPKVGSRLLK